MIKAIETVYNGYRFRSRLEARWAVFFDTVGIKYEYELQGFDLGDEGRYLPDFWLPTQKCFVEIKPSSQWFFDWKCHALASQGGGEILYITGNPWLGEYGICMYPDGEYACSEASGPLAFALGRKDERELWVANDNRASCLNSLDDCGKWPLHNHPLLLKAYTAGRQARFEHGETP